MRKVQRLIFTALVLALPLLLSQCSTKQGAALPGVRGIKPGEAAKLAEAYDPAPNRQTSRLDRQEIPLDRLENLGDLAVQNHDYESALINFLQILKDQPENYDLRYKVGVIFLLSGQYEAAQRELARVLIKQPEMLAAHEALGLAHLQEKQYPMALEEFRLVLAKEPNRAGTRYLLGVAQLMAGQTREAIAARGRSRHADGGAGRARASPARRAGALCLYELHAGDRGKDRRDGRWFWVADER